MKAPAYKTIVLPIHPDDETVPTSVIHFPLGGDRYVTFEGPLSAKTLAMVIETLRICEPALVARPEDYEI